MKFIVSSTLLLSHLQTISRVINSKNSMAILDNFLFRLEGTRLSMTASDQETTMTTAIDVMEAEGEGVFAVNAKILLEPLKELPDQPLTFEIDDNNLEIFLYFQNGRYNFIGVNGDEYPTKMPMDPSAVNLSLDAQQLLNGIGFWRDICDRYLPHSRFIVQEDRQVFTQMLRNPSAVFFTTDAPQNNMDEIHMNHVTLPILDDAAHVSFRLLARIDGDERATRIFNWVESHNHR